MACVRCGFTDFAEIDQRCLACGHINCLTPEHPRKLKPQSSNEESPDKKFQKVDKNPNPPTDMPTMMQQMMNMMTSLQSDMRDVKHNVEQATSDASQAKQTASQAMTSVEAVQVDIATIKESMVTKATLPSILKDILPAVTTNFSASPSTHPLARIGDPERDRTMVITGLKDLDAGAVKEWTTQKLKTYELQTPPLPDLYYKGDVFTGTLFCKFSTIEHANQAISTLSEASLHIQDSPVKFKRDRPIAERAPLGFLLGLRWHLTQWGFDKKAIKINEDNFTLRFNGKELLSAQVKTNSLVICWKDEEWSNWKALQESAELKELVETANKKLQKSSPAAKGDGKGNKGQPTR